MYDEIICEETLPLPKGLSLEKDYVFQTKDLNCFLQTFVIQNNRLYERKPVCVAKTSEEIEKEKAETKKSRYIPVYPEKITGYENIPMQFTGSINFYNFIELEEKDHWIEFVALFSNGYLIKSIDLAQHEITDNTKRKEFSKQRREEAIQYAKYCKTWRGRIHVMFIKFVCKNILKAYFSVLEKLISFGYYVQRKIS